MTPGNKIHLSNGADIRNNKTKLIIKVENQNYNSTVALWLVPSLTKIVVVVLPLAVTILFSNQYATVILDKFQNYSEKERQPGRK